MLIEKEEKAGVVKTIIQKTSKKQRKSAHTRALEKWRSNGKRSV